jgi:hypothetical protein
MRANRNAIHEQAGLACSKARARQALGPLGALVSALCFLMTLLALANDNSRRVVRSEPGFL